MPSSVSPCRLPLPSLLLGLLLGLWGATGEKELQVVQPVKSVSVAAGGTVTLNCTVTSVTPVGPTKWIKGTGPGEKTIFDFKGDHRRDPRVSSASDTTMRDNLDFSVRLSSVTTDDSGVYYCVKFRKGSPDDVKVKSGGGTAVSVHAKPSAPRVSSPTSRIYPGRVVSLNCTSSGFFPANVSLRWFQDSVEVPALQTFISPAGAATSYSVFSTVLVTLSVPSIRSRVTCQVGHEMLRGPLTRQVELSRLLRVLPTVAVAAHRVPRLELVILTCHVQRFYPANINISWVQGGRRHKPCGSLTPTNNTDGTFSLDGHLLVSFPELEGTKRFTCLVEDENQTLLRESLALRFDMMSTDKVLRQSGSNSNSTPPPSARLGARPLHWELLYRSQSPRCTDDSDCSSLVGMFLLPGWKLVLLITLSVLFVLRRHLSSSPLRR